MVKTRSLTANLIGGAIVLAVAGACQTIAGISDKQLDPGQPSRGFGRFRRQITIKASASVPASYSVRLELNHAELFARGDSLVGGDDVRIFQWTGTEWRECDRVLGLDSTWNTEDTVLWFKVSDSIPAAGRDESYYVYYGNEKHGNEKPLTPPADPNQVFVFFDDFESGSLDRWRTEGQDQNYWEVDPDRGRGGGRSLRGGPLPLRYEGRLIASKEVNESDVALDAYWRVSQAQGMELAQGFRANELWSDWRDWYEAILFPDSYWSIAWWYDSSWKLHDRRSVPQPTAGTWVRITTTMVGNQMNVYHNLEPTVPPTGSQQMEPLLPSGTIVFVAYRVAAGQTWWVDDVRVRKLVQPEPTLSLGPEEAAPDSDP